jgi:hypothetical protein
MKRTSQDFEDLNASGSSREPPPESATPSGGESSDWLRDGLEGGDQEGEAPPSEGASDGESADEDAPLPGGRRADEISRMLQAREESASGLET